MKRLLLISGEETRIARHDCHGLTLVEIVVVVVVLAIAGLIALSIFREAQKRRLVAFTRSNMRSLAIANEGYVVDWSIYPAWGIGHPGPGNIRTFNWDATQRTGNRSGVADLSSYLLSDPSSPAGRFGTLSTLGDVYFDKSGAPIHPAKPYITTYPLDRFCPDRGATFVYWGVFPGMPLPEATQTTGPLVGGVGFILVSPGPDGRYDLPGSYSVYNPGVSQPSALLLAGTNPKGIAFTYDPTNGLVSCGDIWRVKQ